MLFNYKENINVFIIRNIVSSIRCVKTDTIYVRCVTTGCLTSLFTCARYTGWYAGDARVISVANGTNITKNTWRIRCFGVRTRCTDVGRSWGSIKSGCTNRNVLRIHRRCTTWIPKVFNLYYFINKLCFFYSCFSVEWQGLYRMLEYELCLMLAFRLLFTW